MKFKIKTRIGFFNINLNNQNKHGTFYTLELPSKFKAFYEIDHCELSTCKQYILGVGMCAFEFPIINDNPVPSLEELNIELLKEASLQLQLLGKVELPLRISNFLSLQNGRENDKVQPKYLHISADITPRGCKSINYAFVTNKSVFKVLELNCTKFQKMKLLNVMEITEVEYREQQLNNPTNETYLKLENELVKM